MATRTLEQIITELRSPYDAQAKSLQERANLIPQQIEAEEQGLNAKKDQAFSDILNGARRRGLGFAGIPLGEQAQYASTEYAPSLARLRMSGREQAMSLQDAILGINERRDTLANQLYQQEQDREFQRTQAEAQRAFEAQQAEANRRAQRAAAAAALPTFGVPPPSAQSGPRFVQSGKGGSFYDANNRPITAAQFARQKGMDIRDVLYELGSLGDKQAATFYNQLKGLGNNAALLNQSVNAYKKSAPWIFGGV